MKKKKYTAPLICMCDYVHAGHPAGRRLYTQVGTPETHI